MNSNSTLLNLAKQVQALSEIGKHYADSDYDLDRYSEREGKLKWPSIDLNNNNDDRQS